jgi:hypothetical protein
MSIFFTFASVMKKIIHRIINIKNPLISVVIIFIFSAAYLTLYSLKQDPVEIFDYELKQAKVEKYFTDNKVYIDSLSEFNKYRKQLFAKDTTKEIDSSAQRFLLIGDSMLEGLGPRLNDYCEKNGDTMKRVIWYSSSTLWFGNCDTIAYYVKKFNPTYVILVIGSMELFIRDIKEDRKQYVLNILKQISGLPYVWVGPPNWTKDTGINDLLSENVDKGTYFMSKDLPFDRCSDGVHPTMTSASRWMDSIAKFIMTKSPHRVLLNLPDKKASHFTPTEILSPNPPPALN